MTTLSNQFLARNREKQELNQYWYSQATIEKLASEVDEHGKIVAFLSTPSIYFSIKNEEIKNKSYLFDFDDSFEKKCKGNWVQYDFNNPNTIPKNLHGIFDMVSSLKAYLFT